MQQDRKRTNIVEFWSFSSDLSRPVMGLLYLLPYINLAGLSASEKCVNTAFRYRPGGPERPTLQDTTTRSLCSLSKLSLTTVIIRLKKLHILLTKTYGPQTERFEYTEWEVLNGQYTTNQVPAHHSCRESLVAYNASGVNLERFPHKHPSVSKCRPSAPKHASDLRDTRTCGLFTHCSSWTITARIYDWGWPVLCE